MKMSSIRIRHDLSKNSWNGISTLKYLISVTFLSKTTKRMVHKERNLITDLRVYECVMTDPSSGPM